MFNIIYSNRYEVLQKCLIENLRADYRNPDVDPVFSPLQVIVPNTAVSDDLMQSVVEHPDFKGVCMGLKLQQIGAWMEPYGSLWLGKGAIGKTLEWIIWDILAKGDLERELDLNRQGGLGYFLKETESLPSRKYELAIRIAAVFTKYINYRFDWVLEWLGEQGKRRNSTTGRLKAQLDFRDKHPEKAWQQALWQKIRERLDGLESLELDSDQAKQDAKGRNLVELVRRIPDSLATTSSQSLPDDRALHFFIPQILPPLALPFLAKEASQREVWLYLMNPCMKYWFGADGYWFGSRSEIEPSVPTNAFLHRNAASTRALIDRIWRFAPEDASQLIPFHEDAVSDKPLPVYKKPHQIPWYDLTKTSVSTFCHQDVAETPLVNSHLVYVKREGKTLLDRIANSILFDEPLAVSQSDFKPEEDKSLRILKATGFVRQVEAVVDWIHDCKRHLDLQPENILVVTPQIEEMAPLIRGVMASQPEDQRIAYRIMGRTELAVNTVASAILKTGRLIHSMLSADGFAEMLALPLMTASWAISLDDVQIMRRWLETAGFRYGIDGEHLKMLAEKKLANGEAETADGTLERAMERLVLGRLTEEGHYQPYGDVLPVYGTENTGFDRVADSDGLERMSVLTNIYTALKGLYARTFEEQRPEVWSEWTEELLRTLFPVGFDQKDILEDIESFRSALSTETEIMRSVLDDRGEDGKESPASRKIPFDVFWLALEKGLVEKPRRQHADGSVIFAGMQDFRCLPFKAVAMIGMDDGPVFPGVNRAEEFDLTQPSTYPVSVLNGENETGKLDLTYPAARQADDKRWLVHRKGDRDSREDNRNVFLDLLLAAQDRVLITYDAGSEPAIPSKALNPSIVVQDLLFWLQESGVDPEQITAVMPLTRYSAGNLWRMENNDRVKDSVRYFRTTDQLVLDAMRVAESKTNPPEEIFIEGSKPLDSIFSASPDKDSVIVLPFAQLADVWNRPDTVVRKAIGMADVEWLESDRTPQVQMPEDRLFLAPLERRILNLLRQGKSTDFLADDPRIGCQEIRQDLLAPVEKRMTAVNDLIQELKLGGVETSLNPVLLEIEGQKVQIPIPEVERCRGDNGEAGYLQVVSSSRERTAAWLLHLLLCASDKPMPMYVVGWRKDNIELQRLMVVTKTEVLLVLTAICQLFKKVMQEKTVFPNHYAERGGNGMERPRFNPFWRHDEAWQDVKNQQKEMLDGKLVEFLSIETIRQKDAKTGETSERKPKRKGAKSKSVPTASELCGLIQALMIPKPESQPKQGADRG